MTNKSILEFCHSTGLVRNVSHNGAQNFSAAAIERGASNLDALQEASARLVGLGDIAVGPRTCAAKLLDGILVNIDYLSQVNYSDPAVSPADAETERAENPNNGQIP